MIKKLSSIILIGLLFTFVLLGASGCGMFGGNQQAAQEEQAKKDKLEQEKQAEAAKAAEEAKKAQEEKERLEKAEKEKAQAEQEALEAAKAKAEQEKEQQQVAMNNNVVVPTINKVLVGPYTNYAKAKAAVLKLRKTGFGDAFVKEYDGKHWAQLGSYKSPEAANAILEQAKRKKYDGTVVQE